jgi:predicted aldo/keto reductase-like oxidoreductase
MLYRTFGKTGEKVSALGFGCMRLPVIGGAPDKIDESQALRMVRYAIDEGVNYIDTAYPYHSAGSAGGGQSEPFVAKALKDGYRQRVNVATKLPTWLIHTREDMDRYLDEQLQRLQTDHIDFYLLHALNRDAWHNVRDLGVREFLDRALRDGKIRYAGFSFHDNLDSFKEIVDSYDWSFCQIQYNYLDEENQAGTAGLQYAAAKGLGVTVMEPLRGGCLTDKLPESVLEAWKKSPVKRSPAQLALRWVMNHPEVSVVLSGMSTMQQVEENIQTACNSAPGSLTTEEADMVEFARKTMQSMIQVNCTGCRYCMPCPAGVNIPENFGIYNSAFLFGSPESAKEAYFSRLDEKARASTCVTCGRCEKLCPQHIAIRQELKKVRAAFE